MPSEAGGGGGGGGGYGFGRNPHERGGDAHRLVSGCKFLISASLRVFLAKRHYLAVKVSFRVAHEEIFKTNTFSIRLI